MPAEAMDLQALNEYLKSVVDLIPAQSYFMQSKTTPARKPFEAKKKRKATGGNEKGNENTSHKSAKKAKLHKSFMKTTSAHITSEVEIVEGPARKRAKNQPSEMSESAQSLTALQQRLKDRITDMQQQRKPRNKSEEEIAQVRMRRKKERAKFKLRAKLKREQSFKTGSVEAEVEGKVGHARTPLNNKPSKPENSDGRAVFSKFDFGKDTKAKNKKSRKNDLRTLLIQAESKVQKYEEVKENEPEKAEGMLKKDSWGKALAKAEGTKIRDNPELLRKSLKKEQAIKKQHTKKWKEREDRVEEKMKKKQDKRSKNIQARKDQVKQKNIAKRAKKFLKSVPGF